jgi:molybdopterin-containing oxidoreductase family membrane subunit
MADAFMQSHETAAERIKRAPLVTGNRTMSWITDHVASVTEKGAPMWWWIAFTISSALALVSFFCIAYLISTGVGVWGLNHPVGWAWDITNFVFWIGIGHAGTLISAILFLTRQKWRTSINRAAEAMTLFAVVCAGIFPAVHVGRIWMVWFLAPVPNSNAIWQNFRSPLLWDVFAVSTYFTVSVLFWYTGLVPDLATLRDRAKTKLRKFFYGIAALGWRGGNRQWKHYEMAYLILAGLSTPLVLSVHSVVSFDFATSVIPGWHTTIFPPYFVAGAIFGGFAMVLTIMLPARAIFGLHDLITDDHVDKMCKIILLTGSIVGYAYAMEFFIAWYGGNMFEQYAFINRATGPYWWAYWSMIFCNVVAPQLFWFRFFRRHVLWVFVVCMFVNAGMWFERFVIIVTSLHRDFLPSSWNMFYPTWVDIWTFVGTFGIFLALFLLFIRWLPMICIFEVKAVLPEADPHHGHDDHQHEPAAAVKGATH